MQIEESVKSILSELSGEENIQNEATLQDDLAMDSLSMVSLLIGIEDVFEIELNEADMNPFALGTVQDVVNLVEKYAGERYE